MICITRWLFWPKVVRLICDIIAEFHLQRRTEELPIGDGGVCIPDLDNVEVSLGRQCHTGDGVIVALQQTSGQTMNHTIRKDCVGLRGIHLLRPRPTLIILRRIPQGAIPLLHKEEHSRIPGFCRDGFDDGPEILCSLDLHDLDVALQRVVCIVGIVIPESKRHPTPCLHSGFFCSFSKRKANTLSV